MVFSRRNGRPAVAARTHDAPLCPGETTYGTLCALVCDEECSLQHLDFEIVGRILADATARQACTDDDSAGAGLSLQHILQAYHSILPDYNINPADDVHLYSLLLKLSCDTNADWWAKLHREYHSHGFSQWAHIIHQSSSKPAASIPEDGMPFCTSLPVRTSTAATSWAHAKQGPCGATPVSHSGQPAVLADISNRRPVESLHSVTAEALGDFKLVNWCFSTWHHHSNVIRTSRSAKEHALQRWRAAVCFWELNLVRRCFHHIARLAVAKATAAAECASSLALRRCLRAWDARTKEALAAMHAACSLSQRRALKMALRSWVALSHWAKLKATNELVAAVQCRRNRLLAVLATWRAEALEASRMCRVAAQAYRGHTMSSALASWHAIARQLRQQAAHEHLLKTFRDLAAMRSAMVAWHSRYKTRCRQQQLLSRAVARIANHTAAMAFAMWKAFTAYSKQERWAWEAAVSCADASCTLNAWRSWRLHHNQKRRRQQQILRASTFWKQRVLESGLSAWKAVCMHREEMTRIAQQAHTQHLQQLIRLVLCHWLGARDALAAIRQQAHNLWSGRVAAMRASCLREWKLRVDYRQELGKMASDAWHHAAAQKLAAAMRHWVSFCRARRWERLTDQQLARHSVDCLTGFVVSAWQSLLQQESNLLNAQRHLSNRWAKLALAAWQAVTRRLAARQATVQGHVDQKQRAFRMACFQAWRQHSARASLLFQLQTAHHSKVQKGALRVWVQHWRFWTVQQQAMHRANAMAANAWASGACRSSLRHWGSQAKHLVWQKQQMAAAQLLVTRRMWAAWQQVCMLARRSVRTAVQHSDCRLQRLASHCVQHWLAAAREAALQREHNSRATEHCETRSLATTFSCWRARSSRRRLQAAVLSAVRRRKAAHTTMRTFLEWRSYAQMLSHLKQRGAEFLAMVVYRRQLASWLLWRSHFAMKKCAQRAWAYWQRRHMKAALHALQLAAVKAQQFHAVLKGIGDRTAKMLEQQYFVLWQEYFVQARQKKLLLFRAVFRWVASLLAASFANWLDFAAARQHRRQVARACVQHWRTGLGLAAMQAWRRWCKWKQHKATAAIIMACRRASRALWAWNLLAAACSYLTGCSKTIAAKHKQLVMAGCVAAWAAWKDGSMANKMVMEVADLAAAAKLLCRVWKLWLIHSAAVKVKVRQVDQARTHLQHRTASAVWRGWVAHVNATRRLRQLQLKRVRAVKLGALSAWRCEVQTKQLQLQVMRKVANMWQHYLLLHAWSSWREFVNERRALLQSLLDVVQRWQHGKLPAVFDQWRCMVQRGRARHTADTYCQRQLKKKTVQALISNASWQQFASLTVHRYTAAAKRKVLQSWACQARCSATQQDMEHRIILQLRAKRMHAVLAAFRQCVVQQRNLRQLGGMLLNIRIAKAFVHWRQFATQSTKLGVAAEGLAACMHFTMLSRSLLIWKARAGGMAWKRYARQAARAQYAAHLSRQCLREWHAAAFKASRTRTAEAFYMRTAVAGWVMHWRWWAVARQFRRSAANQLLLIHAMHMLQRAWKAWTHRISQWVLMRSIHTTATRLHTCRLLLHAWQCWTAGAEFLLHLHRAGQALLLKTTLKSMQRAFQHWWLHTVGKRQQAAVSEWWVDKRMRNVLQHWNALTKWMAATRQALNLMLTRRRQHRLRLAFSAWLVISHQLLSLKAVLFHRARATAKTLLADWFQTTAVLRRASSIVTRRLLREKQQLLCAWREIAALAAYHREAEQVLKQGLSNDATGLVELMQYVVVRWRNQALYAAFDAWMHRVVDLTDLRSRSAAAFELVYRNICRKVLHGFQSHVHTRRTKHQADQAWQRKLLVSWATFVRRRATTMWKLASFIHRLQLRTAQQCLLLWRAEAARLVQWHHQTRYHQFQVAYRLARKVLHTWQALAGLKLMATQQLVKHMLRRLHALFRAWQQTTAARLSARAHSEACVTNARELRAHRLRSACFWFWKQLAHEQAMQAKAVVWWALNLLRSAFYSWLITRRATALLASTSALRRCLRHWMEWLHSFKWRNLRQLQAALHYRDAALCKAVSAWAAWTAYAQQLRVREEALGALCTKNLAKHALVAFVKFSKAVRFWKCFVQQRCLESWLLLTKESLDLHARHGYLLGTRQFNILRLSLSHWLWEVQAQQERERAITAALHAGDQRCRQQRKDLLAGVLYAWAGRAALLSTVCEMAWHVQRRKLRLASLAWLATATRASRQRQVADAFCARWQLKTCTMHWKRVTEQRLQARMARLQQAVHARNAAHAAAVLRNWHVAADLQVRRSNALVRAFDAADAAVDMERKWISLELWRKHHKHAVAAAQVNMTAMQHRGTHVLRTALLGWQQAACSARRQSLTTASSSHSLQSSASLVSRTPTTPEDADRKLHTLSPRSPHGSALGRPHPWSSLQKRPERLLQGFLSASKPR